MSIVSNTSIVPALITIIDRLTWHVQHRPEGDLSHLASLSCAFCRATAAAEASYPSILHPQKYLKNGWWSHPKSFWSDLSFFSKYVNLWVYRTTLWVGNFPTSFFGRCSSGLISSCGGGGNASRTNASNADLRTCWSASASCRVTNLGRELKGRSDFTGGWKQRGAAGATRDGNFLHPMLPSRNGAGWKRRDV